MSNREKEKEDLKKLQESQERRFRERNGSSTESTNTSRDISNYDKLEVTAIPVTMASGSQEPPVMEPIQFIVRIPERNQKYIAVRPPACGRMGPIPFSPIIGPKRIMLRCPQPPHLRPVFNFPVEQPNEGLMLPPSPPDVRKRSMKTRSYQRVPTPRPPEVRRRFDRIPPLIPINDEPRPSTSSNMPGNEGNRGNVPPRHEPREISHSRNSAFKPILPVWIQEELDDVTQNSADIHLRDTSLLELPRFNEGQASKSWKIYDSCSTSAGKALSSSVHARYSIYPQARQEQVPSTLSFTTQYEYQAPPRVPPMAHTNSSIDVKFSIAKILGQEDDSDICEMPLDLRVTRFTEPVPNVQPTALPTEPPTTTGDSSNEDRYGKRRKKSHSGKSSKK